MHEIQSPPIPKCRRSLRSEEGEKSYSLNNNFQSSQIEKKMSRNTSNLSEEELSGNESIDGSCDKQREETSKWQNTSNQSEKKLLKKRKTSKQQNTSNVSETKEESEITDFIGEANTPRNKTIYFTIIVIVIGLITYSMVSLIFNKNKEASSNPSLSKLIETIETVKKKFYNQDSDIWNDILSAINEVITSTPKMPSIILLFAEETTVMNCLATELVQMSSIILKAKPLILDPKNFGDDAGEIITALNKYPPEEKKVVLIHNILNISTEAIKALHNLCDRINPLIAEALYILTMQTDSYQQKNLFCREKLRFVENQISNKLSKSINQDVLMALITRITDGAIISVQSEPQIKYC